METGNGPDKPIECVDALGASHLWREPVFVGASHGFDEEEPNMRVTAFVARTIARLVILTFALPSVVPSSSIAGDLLVGGQTPNQLFVIDGTTDQVVKQIPLSGVGTPVTIVFDQRNQNIVYVTTNRWQSICAVDIDKGKELKCIDLSRAENGSRVVVRAGALDVNPKTGELYVYELPVKELLGRYEILPTRIEVFDPETLEPTRNFEAPRQATVMAFSPDGSRLYTFHVGDIYEYDSSSGKIVRRTPLVYHNVTGMGGVDGLPFYPNYAESGYVVAFGYGAEDPFHGTWQVGLGQFDLKTGGLEMYELAPFGPNNYYLGALASRKTGRAYLCWNLLSMVDLKERRIVKSVLLDHTRFFPVLSTDGKKLYLPRGSGETVAVYDAATLKPLKIIALQHNMAATSMRRVTRSD